MPALWALTSLRAIDDGLPCALMAVAFFFDNGSSILVIWSPLLCSFLDAPGSGSGAGGVFALCAVVVFLLPSPSPLVVPGAGLRFFSAGFYIFCAVALVVVFRVHHWWAMYM